MSAAWSMFVVMITLMSIAGVMWLLVSNRNKPADGKELDHEFDGIRELDTPLPAWWVGLFVGSSIFALGYVFYYPALGNMAGASGWTSQKEWSLQTERHEERFSPLFAKYAEMSPEALMSDRGAMQTGRRLFLNYCSTCHGVAAKGGRAFPNLTDEEWIWGSDFNAIKQTIVHGRNAQMPAWEQVLNPEQLTDVVNYVLSLSDASSSGDAHASGKSSYTTYCMACHGANAKGNPVLGAPNISNDIWLYGGDVADVTESIAKGRAGMMPAQGSILGEDRVHLLAAYVMSLSAPPQTGASTVAPSSRKNANGD